MDHDAYRWPLAVWAQQYKQGSATFKDESLMLEYLLHDISCNDGDTTVNTASQLQFEYAPADVLDAKYIGFTAVLASPANVTVTVGGRAMAASWQIEPADDAGVYRTYFLFCGPIYSSLISL